MQFNNTDRKLTRSEIASVERELSLSFPHPLVELFLNHNGGEPEPYVFDDFDQFISTIVSETLPLLSDSDRGTAVQTYYSLVLEKALVPKSCFPFAVDGGGDYFFVDCASGSVYFLDTARYPSVEFKDLNCQLEEFWRKLHREDDA